MRHLTGLLTGFLCVAPALALAADPNAGKEFFRQQCALCHSAEPNDAGGAQGPGLNGVFGRRAGTAPGFSYTQALRDSGLTWDRATLDHFLASPSSVVPGSRMTVAIPNSGDRENVIAYLQAVKEGTFKAAPTPAPAISAKDLQPFLAGYGCHASDADVEKAARATQDFRTMLTLLGCKLPAAGNSRPDWKLDAPGRRHRIQVANLPPPFVTPAAVNPPQLIPKPAGAELRVPKGFHVNVFASDLAGPRNIRVAPNGDVFVAETDSGRVTVLRPSSDGSTAGSATTFAQGLVGPFGMQFYPSWTDPQWLYVAENNRVVRYAYTVGDREARSTPEVVLDKLTATTGGHTTRDIAFSPDGKRLFISIGSGTNVAEGMSKKTAAEARAWEAEHGRGAAWDADAGRADVLVHEMGSDQAPRTFATGIRNCVGLTIQPGTGDLWCTANERDLLGDDLVPDYSTRVKEGGFYGWPWYYMGRYEDPRLKGDRPDLAGKAIVPDVPYQAHSAALTLTFYTATSGRSVFPKRYAGDGFAVLHGSWNRALRTGHKVVRVRMKHGVPTGEYEDFLVGFIADDAHAWGRPVGVAVASDGSLLISDDGANLIYRVSYSR